MGKSAKPTAHAAILRDIAAPLTIEPVLLGEIAPGEIQVRLVATGICHTDLIVIAGMLPVPRPVILGHEGAGIVEVVGSAVSHLAPGDHVVLSFGSCGDCPACASCTPSYCVEFTSRNFSCARPDGTTGIDASERIHTHFFSQSSFSSQILCPARNAIKMPKEIGLAGLAPLGCGILTGAGAILNALKVTAGASVAIIGAGAVGLSAVMACVLVGATSIVVVDRITDRLMLAAEFGATGTIDTSSVALEEAFDAVKASGFDYVLDTSGVPFLIETAIRALAIRGKLGLVAPGPDFTMPVMSLIGGGREVRGIIEGDADPAELLPRLLAWHREGIFPFDRMIRFYPFDKINEAIADAVAGTVIKPVLRFDDYSAL